ncbi:nucleotide cyclase, partial [Suillus lakei]
KVCLAKTIARLEREVPPPVGHVCLVFTDVRNPAQKIPECPQQYIYAIACYHDTFYISVAVLSKTEGDALCAPFQLPLPRYGSAFCPTSTSSRTLASKEVYDEYGNHLARGLSVRMGIHSGTSACELDPITRRMDYPGSMLNRSARICASALGGQIMCGSDVICELYAGLFEISWSTLEASANPGYQGDPATADGPCPCQ